MIIPDGFAQANLQFGGADFPSGAEITFGVSLASYAGDPTSAAEDIAAITNTDLASFWGPLTNFVQVLVKFGPNDDGPFGTFPGGGGGAGSGLNVPANTSVLIRKNTALGGRKHNGRLFWPWVSEGNVTGAGVIAGGVVSTMQTEFEGWLDDLLGADLPMVLLHGDALTAPDTVTSLSVQAQVATQRRRLRR